VIPHFGARALRRKVGKMKQELPKPGIPKLISTVKSKGHMEEDLALRRFVTLEVNAY
jgi:hypothetical protein